MCCENNCCRRLREELTKLEKTHSRLLRSFRHLERTSKIQENDLSRDKETIFTLEKEVRRLQGAQRKKWIGVEVSTLDLVGAKKPRDVGKVAVKTRKRQRVEEARSFGNKEDKVTTAEGDDEGERQIQKRGDRRRSSSAQNVTRKENTTEENSRKLNDASKVVPDEPCVHRSVIGEKGQVSTLPLNRGKEEREDKERLTLHHEYCEEMPEGVRKMRRKSTARRLGENEILCESTGSSEVGTIPPSCSPNEKAKMVEPHQGVPLQARDNERGARGTSVKDKDLGSSPGDPTLHGSLQGAETRERADVSAKTRNLASSAIRAGKGKVPRQSKLIKPLKSRKEQEKRGKSSACESCKTILQRQHPGRPLEDIAKKGCLWRVHAHIAPESHDSFFDLTFGDSSVEDFILESVIFDSSSEDSLGNCLPVEL